MMPDISGKDAGFPLFLALWNRRQNMGTPAIHFDMASWLSGSWEGGHRRLLLQAFRSSGKSTITGLFAAWLLYRNPDLRLIVLAADLMLARKMVRNVRRIIERHPLTASLRPERLDQWGADRFTVRRRLELRDPSMLARGIGANMTGSRADVIICDDVEVPNTCDTAEKRRDLRERLGEIEYVLVPGGTLLYIGTPHSWFTLYADAPRREAGEEKPFLDGFRRLSIPVLDAEGNSAWPERFTIADIDRMRGATGPNKFASQMMLIPVNVAEGRLDPERLHFYDGALEKPPQGGLYLSVAGEQARRLASCSAWWDPAFGKGDGSVLAVVFTDGEGHVFLHRVAYLKTDGGHPDDEATQQCAAVAAVARELHVPFVAVEINGIGRFLPAILRRELARARVPCAVREISSTRPKDVRILEAFDALLAARGLRAHDSVLGTPFVTEMREWRPGRAGGRDDGLDAVAGALSLEPVRIRRESFAGRQGWAGGGLSHTARTEFEI